MSGQTQLGFVALYFCAVLAVEGEAAASPGEGRTNPPSKVTRALLEKLPKYVPPAATRPVEAPSSRDVAAGDVLQLPTVTVRPDANPLPPDDAFLNAKGRLELAIKAHPGIKIGNLLGMNEGIAHEMQREEWLAGAQAETAAAVQRAAIGDSEMDKKIRKLMKAALQRSGPEWTK